MSKEPAPTSSLLDQLRSYIQVLSMESVLERDGLREERDQLLEAFLHVFPYANYRDQRPDLASMNDQQIAEYFAHKGIKEGVSLEAKVITNKALKSLQEANEELQVKQDDLEALFADYSSRLSALHDLIGKLSLKNEKIDAI